MRLSHWCVGLLIVASFCNVAFGWNNVMQWVGTGDVDDDWFTDDNWKLDEDGDENDVTPAWPPYADDMAILIDGWSGEFVEPVISSGDAVAARVSIPHYGTVTGSLRMTGGTLTCNPVDPLGYVDGVMVLGQTLNATDPDLSAGTLNMEGGVLTLNGSHNNASLLVGFGGKGSINMSGGEIHAAYGVIVGSWQSANGHENDCHINLSGGTIYAGGSMNFYIRPEMSTADPNIPLNTVNLTGGKIVIEGTNKLAGMWQRANQDMLLAWDSPDNTLLRMRFYAADPNDPNTVDTTIVKATDCPNPPDGDSNGDCIVDLQDLAEVAGSWQTVEAFLPVGDVTWDGDVDMEDLSAVADTWLECTREDPTECP